MSLGHSTSIVQRGLVHCCDSLNTKSLSAASTSWKSLVNTQQHTIYGCTRNGVLTFVADSDYTSFDASVIWSSIATGSFTLEFISKCNDLTYPRSLFPFYIQDIANVAAARGLAIGAGTSNGYIPIRIADGTTLYTGQWNVTAPSAAPYHRAFTIDRSAGISVTYYQNNVSQGSLTSAAITGSIYNSGTFLVFGSNWGWRYNGDLYTFRIYDRILSPVELTQNFNATRRRFNL